MSHPYSPARRDAYRAAESRRKDRTIARRNARTAKLATRTTPGGAK